VPHKHTSSPSGLVPYVLNPLQSVPHSSRFIELVIVGYDADRHGWVEQWRRTSESQHRKRRNTHGQGQPWTRHVRTCLTASGRPLTNTHLNVPRPVNLPTGGTTTARTKRKTAYSRKNLHFVTQPPPQRGKGRPNETNKKTQFMLPRKTHGGNLLKKLTLYQKWRG
jgi:hypothetical protein